MSRKLALVTGGSGFIGSHLVDLLVSNGWKVRVIDNFVGGRLENLSQHVNNSALDVLNADICQIDSKSHFFRGVQVTYHLAAIGDIVPSIEKPLDYMRTNVYGTVNILESSRLNSIKRFVYAASSSCYGIANTPTDEKHPINPKYPYALSKYLGEFSSFHWQDVYGLEVNSVCIFNAYGLRTRTSGAYGAVLGVFLKQRLEGAPLTIVGDGNQSRDFVHVTDVARAFYLAGTSQTYGHRFNIGSGNPVTVMTLASLISDNFVFLPKRPAEPDITFANIEKARLLLGWSPQKEFVQGVDELLTNIQEWKDAPLWNESSISLATEKWFHHLGKNDV
jgi:UDP-glucose 4-epimerase